MRKSNRVIQFMEGVLSELFEFATVEGNVIYLEVDEVKNFLGVNDLEAELMDELEYEILKNPNVIDIDQTSSGIEILIDEDRECYNVDYDSYLLEELAYK